MFWMQRAAAIVSITGMLLTVIGSPTAQAQSAAEFNSINRYVGQLVREGKYGEATPMAHEALARAERVLGGEHPETLAAINNLATLYYTQGGYDRAEALYKRVLAVREKTLGPEHPGVAESLNNLAELYKTQARHAEAEPLYKRALAIIEKIEGPEHPNAAVTLDNLAALQLAQGRYAEAEPLMKRALAIWEKSVGPDHPDVSTSLNNLATLYRTQGRYAEAEPLFKRALAIDEKVLGPGHPEVAISLNNLATLYRIQDRFTDAEPLYKRALAILEGALGPNHPNLGTLLDNLAALYSAQGRYAEAEPLVKRALAIWEKAANPNHPNIGALLGKLARLHVAQGRYLEAEPLFQRAVAIREAALGPNHPDVGQSIEDIATLYAKQGRYTEAEPLYQRVLAIREKSLPLGHRDIGASLNNLAELYRAEGRFADAELFYKRALSISEKTLGPDHSDTGTTLNNLALLYQTHERFSEAEPLMLRSLAIREKALGAGHRGVAESLDNIAVLYLVQGRLAEAEPYYVRALSIWEEAAGPDHPSTAASLNNLGGLYSAQGRYADAERLMKRALAIVEKVLGADHGNVASALSNLAELYLVQGRFAEAAPLYERALAIRSEALPADHPDVGASQNNLAGLYFEQGDWTRAAESWRKSTSGILQRAKRSSDELGQALTGKKKAETERKSWQFSGLVKATYRLDSSKQGADAQAARDMFQTAQWAIASEAAQSLGQMAARGATGDAVLAALVRERQDLVTEWQGRDRARSSALAQGPANRDRSSEDANMGRLGAIDARIAAIDERLKGGFANYAAFANPVPLSVEEVQAQLGDDEALILFLDTDGRAAEETFVWVVSKTGLRWVRSDLGKRGLAREVRALRCGLDETEWATQSHGKRCADLLGLTALADQAAPLPFDHMRAHRLYKALFGEVEDLIKGKRLLIVPSGALTQLPFQVLVKSAPANGDHRSASWLIRDHAVTVMPAVSSLRALRQVARPSAAAKPIIGFGNPLLDGPDRRYADLARLAREKQQCGQGIMQHTEKLPGIRGGVMPIETLRGLADVSHIRQQVPLPETADELCAVANDLHAEPGEMRLGTRATESEVKALSADGQLAQYRIVHFATHGALAGELDGSKEPGLLLTPPEEATSDDDGYLSASEIAGLKLDAEWVILSACNTAAGDASGAQALSGLARAFIYAQARALLVSHWAVDSHATVKLITAAAAEMNRGNAGRAEALRRAILALIDTGGIHEAHPAYWAPFVVVGEGGR